MTGAPHTMRPAAIVLGLTAAGSLPGHRGGRQRAGDDPDRRHRRQPGSHRAGRRAEVNGWHGVAVLRYI